MHRLPAGPAGGVHVVALSDTSSMNSSCAGSAPKRRAAVSKMPGSGLICCTRAEITPDSRQRRK
jgi:hypothetical protein